MMCRRHYLGIVFLCILVLAGCTSASSEPFALTILHTDDVGGESSPAAEWCPRGAWLGEPPSFGANAPGPVTSSCWTLAMPYSARAWLTRPRGGLPWRL